jgi:hypothetical protein
MSDDIFVHGCFVADGLCGFELESMRNYSGKKHQRYVMPIQMEVACAMYWGEEKYVQFLGGETRGKGATRKT